MRDITLIKILTLTANLALFVGEAAAQSGVRCPEGRTSSGECVNPGLARVQRQSAIILAQPKISLTAPLQLPSQDAFYPQATDHHQASVFTGFAFGRFYRTP